MREQTMLVFLRTVKFVAQHLGYDIFCAAEENGVGYVAYSNTGSKAILNLKNSHAKWEKANANGSNQ